MGISWVVWLQLSSYDNDDAKKSFVLATLKRILGISHKHEEEGGCTRNCCRNKTIGEEKGIIFFIVSGLPHFLKVGPQDRLFKEANNQQFCKKKRTSLILSFCLFLLSSSIRQINIKRHHLATLLVFHAILLPPPPRHITFCKDQIGELRFSIHVCLYIAKEDLLLYTVYADVVDASAVMVQGPGTHETFWSQGPKVENHP